LAVMIGAASSSTNPPANGPNLELWIPTLAAAIAAVVIVLLAGGIALRMSNGMPFSSWIAGSVYAGPAWTAKDSWVTNIAAVGALLGAVITDSGGVLKSVILPTPGAGATLLFLIFGGAAAIAPVVYGATAKLESQGITQTAGSVWGFLLAGVASLFAVLGEMATMGLLACAISDSTDTKWAVVVALGIGAIAVGAYSVRSLMYFATLPAPRPQQEPAASAPLSIPIRRSLLANSTFSATL
jgi:hypothetical protein